jgi:uncharacterized protein
MPNQPRPQPSALSRPFWQAAQAGRLVIQRCEDCAAYRWTPQMLCVRCHSERYAWTQVRGLGVVYSFTVVHHAPAAAFAAPYVVAVVRLEEGPLMLTNLVGCEPHEIRIDMPVEVVFEPIGGNMNVYRFRPYRMPAGSATAARPAA